jgi:hypothetical protein
VNVPPPSQSSSSPPRIDPRGRDQLVAETEELAQALSPWQRPAAGPPDAGQALMRIFGRFAEIVVDRINRAPEKNYLAYLDLIGTTPIPPRPAGVPLTFTVAEGAPVAPVVPAGTRVGGPPLPGPDGELDPAAEEVVFETESTLVCTAATLVAAWASDTETDTAADRSAVATGVAGGADDVPFGLFGDPGMPLMPHELYLACDPLFDLAARSARDAARAALVTRATDTAKAAETARATAVLKAAAAVRAAAAAGVATGAAVDAATKAADAAAADSVAAETAAGKAEAAADAAAAELASSTAPDDAAEAAASRPLTVTVSITTPDVWQWSTWPVSWAAWDGTVWRPVAATVGPARSPWQVTLAGVAPQATEVGGVTARWVRARLDLALPPPETDLRPEALAVGARNPQPPAFPVAPFDGTLRRFYIDADDAFSAGGSVARLTFRLSRPGAAPATTVLSWAYQSGDTWLSLGQSGPGTAPPAAGFRDETRGLTRDGTVTVPVPMSWPRSLYRTRVGRWLRVDVTGDGYTTTPEIAALRLDVGWDLPRADRITIAVPGAAAIAPPVCLAVNDYEATDRSAAAANGPAFTPFIPTADTEPALYLAFDRPFETRPVAVYLPIEPSRPEEVAADRLAELDPAAAPRLAWEYSAPGGWRPLGVLDDTAGFTVRGAVRFVGPADPAPRRCFGREGWWVRVRFTGGAFPLPPRVRRVLTNTVWARHLTAVDEEILGSGTGNAHQAFTAAQTPVQPGHRLLVRERERPSPDEERVLRAEEGDDAVAVTTDDTGLPDEVWVRWHAVPDLYGSGPRDRHYTLDALTGRVRFGDGTSGTAPPPGQNNVRLSYRAGGGAAGNRPAGTLVELRSAIPSVEGVTNHEAAGGGADAEPLARLTARGPRVLRHRDRAVAAPDLEDLAAAASPDVARAVAIVPSFNPYMLWLDPGARGRPDHEAVTAGRVGVVVVPRADPGSGSGSGSGAERPTPSLGLLGEVREHLAQRLPATAELWVAGPEWVVATVTVTVVPDRPDRADAVAERVRAVLATFLHPLHGGPDGTGWAFAARPRRSQLIGEVEAVDGVDHVRSLQVSLRPETPDLDRAARLRGLLERPLREIAGQAPPDPADAAWLKRALVCSGAHTVSVAFDT